MADVVFLDPVRRLNEQLDHRLREPGAMNADIFDAFVDSQRKNGLVHGTRPLCRHLRPIAITEETYRCVAHASERVVAAIERVARRAIANPDLGRELGLSEEEQELAAIDPGYRETLAVGRLDMLFGDAGFCFIELNADSPAGIVDQELVERTLLRLPHLETLGRRSDLRTPHPHFALLDALREAYAASGGRGRPTIAIVDWSDVDTRPELQVLSEVFSRSGYETLVLDPDSLVYDGRGLFSSRGKKIDLVYRRVIVKELVEQGGIHHPLIEAYRDGKVCVANSFRTKAMNKKAAFAILSDPRFASLFTSEERAVIARHVPWTRRVRPGPTEFRGRRVDLLGLLRSEQERFVLKPNDEYGGRGVILGWEVSPDVWTDEVARAIVAGSIVQERYVAHTIRLPTYRDGVVFEEQHFDLCPFVFGGKMEGAVVRVSESGVTNVSAGGGVSALLIVGNDQTEVLPEVRHV